MARESPGSEDEEGRMSPRTGYPVQFSVDYPDRPLNRLTSAFRIFTAIPIVIVLGALGSNSSYSWSRRRRHGQLAEQRFGGRRGCSCSRRRS